MLIDGGNVIASKSPSSKRLPSRCLQKKLTYNCAASEKERA